jgi:translation initiation factor 1 (eIF-1/SUI1)
MDEMNQGVINTELIEIERLVQEFKEKFTAGTSSADNFISMTEIELLWGELQNKTNNIYSDMIRKLMAEVDESDLIRKKKANTASKT